MKHSAFSFGLLFIVLSIPVHSAPTVVGKIGFSKGSNAAQQPNAPARLLGKDAEVYQGDNIQTSDASFVVVEFIDGSKVTIRPNSNFKIEQFDNQNKNAKLTVYEGAVRATTGEFAKSGKDNFQIKTPTATVKGEKDSDYSVSVCKENCDNNKKTDTAKDVSVAKVVDIKGEVFAKSNADKNAEERKLTLGSGLNVNDHLSSQANSFLVMVFRDNQKVTLQPNTEFDIAKYDYQKTDKKDQILFKLAAGGIRALTGTIGKKDHAAYELDTPVATIGIRGSEGDTQCGESCTGDGLDGNGVYHTTTEGAFTMQTPSGETLIEKGQSAVVFNTQTPPVQIPSPPANITQRMNQAPPASTAPNADNTFSSSGNSSSSTSVKVNEGSATVTNNDDSNSNSDDKDSKNTTLAEGESVSTSESGQFSKTIPETAEQDFEKMPAPQDTSAISSMSSPLNENTNVGGAPACGI